MVPNLPLQRLAGSVSGPFGPAAPSLMPVCPGAGDLHTACPLPDTGPSIPVSHRIATSPSRFNPMCYRKARLPKRPDLPCAPRHRSSEEYSDFRSTLRVR